MDWLIKLMKVSRILWLACVAMFLLIGLSEAQGQIVLRVEIRSPIGVGTSLLVEDALASAEAEGVELVVIELDTPGGLLSATRDIVQSILNSSTPVAVYVAPSGARAASAGTYIAYAAHVVGMAPGTHLGAATPVQMRMPSLPNDLQRSPYKPGERTDDSSQSTSEEKKAINDAVAYLRSLAQLRGRNEAWASKFVADAATLTAGEAYRENVIDVLALDIRNFVEQLDGRAIEIAARQEVLSLSNAEIRHFVPGWKVTVLSWISDPNIVFLLVLLGVYGILFEFWSPGLAGPGVIGAISLLLGLFGLSTLPVNIVGLLLLALGLALMVGEILAPGFGILGLGGILSFILGAFFLFDNSGSDVDLAIDSSLIFVAAITSAFLLMGLMGYLVRSKQQKVITGREELVGLEGQVVSWQGLGGRVRIHGEMWSATSSESFDVGAKVKVVDRDGLTLLVE